MLWNGFDRARMWLRSVPYYPFVLAFYPVTSLLATNIDQVRISDSIRAFAISFGITLFTVLILRMLLRTWQKAALLGIWILLLFFSYGHTYDALKRVVILGFVPGRHLVMIPLWAGIFCIGAWWILRRASNLQNYTMALNLMTIIAMFYPTFQIVSFELSSKPSLNQESFNLQLPDVQPVPDVYYIILDGYSREDVLKDYYGFDNNAFIEALEEYGFYIAANSQSNYALSAFSLASSLNFGYLEELKERMKTGRLREQRLKWLIQENQTKEALGSLGYDFISFETGFAFTEIDDADIYFSQNDRDLNGFEAMLIQSTAMRILTAFADYLPDFLLPNVSAPFEGHRERILYILEMLEGVPRIEGPKFVFAHIVSPHSPYVFGANGEPVEQEGIFTLRSEDEVANWEYHVRGYTDQLQYINTRVIHLMERILNQSEVAPIIILQGDHGGPLSDKETRMPILNAYYFPGHCGEQLYATISPVNTFRLIFDCYFEGEYDLLDDIALYSTYDDPSTFIEVPNAE